MTDAAFLEQHQFPDGQPAEPALSRHTNQILSAPGRNNHACCQELRIILRICVAIYGDRLLGGGIAYRILDAGIRTRRPFSAGRITVRNKVWHIHSFKPH